MSRSLHMGALKVVVIVSNIFCSEECSNDWLNSKSGIKPSERILSPLPQAARNPVLAALLERACCDLCGYNLKDIEREEQRKEGK